MERLLSIDDVASLLGVEESTVYGWTHRKVIPHIKMGRLLRFRESEINTWLQSKAITTGMQSPAIVKPKRKPVMCKSGSGYIDRIVEKAKKEVLKG
ncbi:MAG: helix-turn-helix domain-containing protein [Dissulfurispiraceae bacterium]|jgi:excisionase family DNA binding protein